MSEVVARVQVSHDDRPPHTEPVGDTPFAPYRRPARTTSLAAKASALRTHQVTDAEGESQAATERMSLPVMALLLGFLAFIAYPALTQVLNGL